MKIKVNDELFERIERLARLSLKPEEREKLREDINEILAYMEMLDELDISNVEPLYTPVDVKAPLREDEVKRFEDVLAITHNFPEKEGRLLKVSTVLDKGEGNTKN